MIIDGDHFPNFEMWYPYRNTGNTPGRMWDGSLTVVRDCWMNFMSQPPDCTSILEYIDTNLNANISISPIVPERSEEVPENPPFWFCNSCWVDE